MQVRKVNCWKQLARWSLMDKLLLHVLYSGSELKGTASTCISLPFSCIVLGFSMLLALGTRFSAIALGHVISCVVLLATSWFVGM
jgi:hypothetical protein